MLRKALNSYNFVAHLNISHFQQSHAQEGKCLTKTGEEKLCQNDDDDNTVCMNEKKKKNIVISSETT